MTFCFFIMSRLPPRSTLTDTLFPSTTPFRSGRAHAPLERGSRRLHRRTGDRATRQRRVHRRQPGRADGGGTDRRGDDQHQRSEEHTSELQSLMRITYAVFCLKKKKINAISEIVHATTIHKHTVTHLHLN